MPDDVLKRDRADAPDAFQPPAFPCELLLARITVHTDNVPIPLDPRTPHSSTLGAWAEKTFGWLAPRTSAPPTIPVDVTFERLYLGFLPGSTIPMVLSLAALLGLLPLGLAPVRRRLSRPRP